MLTKNIKNDQMYVQKIQGRHFLEKKNPAGAPQHRQGLVIKLKPSKYTFITANR